ncbi:MAG: hypothetical protein IJZ93_06760 [Clostridia bacterium]|nr:hypothetical protein [Clostridia bacterium]
MKKLLALALAVVALLCCLVGCSSKWTDEDITKAHTVEIIKYNNDDHNTKLIYTITDEKSVKNLCNTFSLLELKRVKITEPTKRSFYIRFIGNGGDIEYVSLIYGHNVIIDSNGDMHKITDDMDINRHLNEVIETAPSEVTRDPEEIYSLTLDYPYENWTFGQQDEPPRFSWTVQEGIPQEYVLEIDYFNDGTYMTKTIVDRTNYKLTSEEWETIINNTPIVDGVKTVRWRVRIDYVYHTDLESYYTNWSTFYIANE